MATGRERKANGEAKHSSKTTAGLMAYLVATRKLSLRSCWRGHFARCARRSGPIYCRGFSGAARNLMKMVADAGTGAFLIDRRSGSMLVA